MVQNYGQGHLLDFMPEIFDRFVSIHSFTFRKGVQWKFSPESENTHSFNVGFAVVQDHRESEAL